MNADSEKIWWLVEDNDAFLAIDPFYNRNPVTGNVREID